MMEGKEMREARCAVHFENKASQLPYRIAVHDVVVGVRPKDLATRYDKPKDPREKKSIRSYPS